MSTLLERYFSSKVHLHFTVPFDFIESKALFSEPFNPAFQDPESNEYQAIIPQFDFLVSIYKSNTFV